MTGADYKNEVLAQLRELHGYSQANVARKVSRTRMMIYYAETGERCTFELLKRIAKVYGIPVHKLIRESSIDVKEPALQR